MWGCGLRSVGWEEVCREGREEAGPELDGVVERGGEGGGGEEGGGVVVGVGGVARVFGVVLFYVRWGRVEGIVA